MRIEEVRARLGVRRGRLPEPPEILTPVRVAPPSASTAGAPSVASHEVPPPDWRLHARGIQAAALALIVPGDDGEALVVLTLRVPRGIMHAGEVSFPGGHAEADDADPVETAIREAHEEIGLDSEDVGLQVVGSLDPVEIVVTGYRLTPVLAIAERRPAYRPQPAEVAAIIEAPLEAFLPGAPIEIVEREIPRWTIRYGGFPVGAHLVWGATGRILGQLGVILAEPHAPEVATPESNPSPTSEPVVEPSIRPIEPADGPALEAFLAALDPDVRTWLPLPSPIPAGLIAIAQRGAIVGVLAWAPDATSAAENTTEAEITLIAVRSSLRRQGLGRRLLAAVDSPLRAAGFTSVIAWTPADAAADRASRAARAFFREAGFVDRVTERPDHDDPAPDRLVLARSIDGTSSATGS
jgi:8-oxo-dGTP pyrophosphatase MutT (NUDIX family)/GNAT superfamily N-acetyltransferase